MSSADKPGRPEKAIPAENHEYIMQFLTLIYGKPVTDWKMVLDISITEKSLHEINSLKQFEELGLMEKFRAIFRVHETQKLRADLKSNHDLIVLLRNIAKKYGYETRVFYSNPKAKSNNIYMIVSGN